MPKCEHCGFGHALPDRCVNCGSADPFPRRRLIKLASGVLAALCVVALGFYFYDRARELGIAEEKARAVAERVYEVGPAGPAEEGATAGAEAGDLKAE